MGKRLGSKKYTFKKRQPGEQVVRVKENTTLLTFLFGILNQQSKSSVKSMLKHGQISVNGRVMTQFDAELTAGDEVGINYGKGRVEFNHPLLIIAWEDECMIVVDKKSGLMTLENKKSNERTVFSLLTAYLKKNDPRAKLFYLNALEKEASGLILFAKTKKIQELFHSSWNQMVPERGFLAIVEGIPEQSKGLLTSIEELSDDKKLIVSAAGVGEDTIIRYQVTQKNGNHALLKIEQASGKISGIRPLLAQAGFPVAGDKKHNSQTNPIGRLAFHAVRLTFIHPETQEKIYLETPVPPAFNIAKRKGGTQN